MAHRDVLWNRVMHIAESMDDPRLPLDQLRAQLCALDEGFAGAFDPAVQFPEFVVHQLCRSLGHLLERFEAGV